MDEELSHILALQSQGYSYTEIGECLGKTKSAVESKIRRARKAGKLADLAVGQNPPSTTGQLTVSSDADAMVLESPRSATIMTLDQLLTACEVDLSTWEVERYVVNKWDQKPDEPLFQVKAWLRPLKALVNLKVAVAQLLQDMQQHAPVYAQLRYEKPALSERHMLEVCLMDLHSGMYAWGEETGADYDSDIACDLARRSVKALLAHAWTFSLERILLPLGNDLAHSDRTNQGAGGMTQKGTSVDVDGRRARLLRMIRMIAVESIDTLRMAAPVDVVMIQGNHDEETVMALGEIVSAWYRNDQSVTVDMSPKPRKYVRYGATLLGFTHGHKGKAQDLPLIMASETPADWAGTTWREWHLGHLHRKGEIVEEHAGVRVRTMPSLAALDAWSAGQGYNHKRAAEAYLWHHDTAYVGHFSVALPGELDRQGESVRLRETLDSV